MMQGAHITDVRGNESADTALVHVKLNRRDERISRRKADVGGKIVYF